MAADPDATQRVSGAPSGNVVPGGASREGVAGAASGTFDRDATQRVLPSSVDAVLTSGQRVFGRYTLEAEVGRGGMGVVWRAHDEELRETVALKFLPTAVARDAAAVDELREETRRARRLTHPNIVRIHDFVRDATLAAVSMELVDGQTLSHWRLEQPDKVFAVEKLASLLPQICAALDYAHEQAKIVHRDLKPANVLVTRDGVVKIADFGIARSLTETQTRLTGVAGGGTSGTLPYMSPQQVLGRKPTVADDIYALGATLYELLTSKPPFHRGDPYSLMMQIRDSIPLTLAEQCSELEVAGTAIPREWEKAILACLAKEPTQRPATIQELAKCLVREVTRHPLPSSAEAERISRDSVAHNVGRGAPSAKLKLRQTGKERKSAVPGERGIFVVHVFPPGAKALVSIGHANDVLVEEGQAIIRDLFDREYDLTVQAPGFLTHTSTVSVAGGGGVAAVELVRLQKGELDVKARPGTIITSIGDDGRETVLGKAGPGKSWRSGKELAAGTYLLRFEHEDCDPATVTGVNVKPDDVTTIEAMLVPFPSELSIVSVPSGADVTIDGKQVGKTPYTAQALSAEEAHKVGIVLDGYESWEELVTLKPREFRTLVASLKTMPRAETIQPSGFVHEISAASRTEGSSVNPWRLGLLFVIVVVVGLSFGIFGSIAERNAESQRARQAEEERAAAERQRAEWARRMEEKRLAEQRAIQAELTSRNPAKPGQSWKVPGLRLDMAWVPAGTFTMGSPESEPGRSGEEGPRTRVTLTRPFWLGRTEVTHGQWKAIMGTDLLAQVRRTLSDDTLYNINGKQTTLRDFFGATRDTDPATRLGPTGENVPMHYVSWEEAMEFCRKLNAREKAAGRLPAGYEYRLPTEAEWEYACRADTTEATYAGAMEIKGENNAPVLDEIAWYGGNSSVGFQGAGWDTKDWREKQYPGGTAGPRDVGTRKPNAWGLHDMLGNMWEWCADWYGNYPGGSVTDPKGAVSGSFRVYRGGSWLPRAVLPLRLPLLARAGLPPHQPRLPPRPQCSPMMA